ncbi:SpoIIE family protein phosphatase [Streptomyces subrutilus]|uniref:GAF domain-containing SpoIIE family protein phosphatase n=1 Tax=Streptomyces subrutilus TaxID=36818 RepID=UPI003442E3D5
MGEDAVAFPADREGARLRALALTGLSAAPDAGMERFAGMVARLLDVPVALVSLVEADRQVFPGMVGLAQPWAGARQTPLSHSLCQYVTASGRPLVLADARSEELTCSSLAIPDLGVVAYAGMPLTDAEGNVLGSLCAIDTSVRHWTERELRDLTDLAAACSSDLQLRIASGHREQARREAQAARDTAEQALAGTELLLRAAEELTGATTLSDVRRRVRDLVSGPLKPSYVGLILLRDGALQRIADPDAVLAMELHHERYSEHDGFPTARALRERRTVTVPDRDHLASHYAPEAVAAFDSLGLASAVCLPLHGARRPLGVIVLGWPQPHEADLRERAVLTAVAGYTAQAVERAVFLEERIHVAHQLQRAMLTAVPEVPGLELAALYLPAAAHDMVGGDWYDAVTLPDPAEGPDTDPDGPLDAGPRIDARRSLAVTVGDVTGHDMHAATVMGQIRSMMRQAALSRPGRGPAATMNDLERALQHLSLNASGTLVHAHIHPLGADRGWRLTWTNAGHPPPLLLRPDGRTRRLDAHGTLFHEALGAHPRTDHELVLEPGSTLLLYTDGLIEQRGRDLDTAIDDTAAALAAHSGLPLADLLRRLAAQVAGGGARDDIVLLALRTEGRT